MDFIGNVITCMRLNNDIDEQARHILDLDLDD